MSWNPATKLVMTGRTYVMSKKEATVSGMVVIGTILKSKSFCILFDSGDTHSFISTWTILQLNLKKDKVWANYKISLPNRQVVECHILYKHVPIVINEHEFLGNLIQFNMLEFNITLGMD